MTQDLHFVNCAKGLICIDLWENDFQNELIKDKNYQAWLEKLSGNLAQFKFDSVINASYYTKIDYNDPSIYNTLIAYNWEDFDQDWARTGGTWLSGKASPLWNSTVPACPGVNRNRRGRR